ncbi:hypothetical protein [Herbaspirillum autotrophicum]|uniref:hypothetical protein n=1 Tax=Herbaspirillum autotrophicum TaxID=180195 RepID=UPI0012EE08A4|nr:hypothetical protein [Herbaspirillum autotrophicum]
MSAVFSPLCVSFILFTLQTLCAAPANAIECPPAIMKEKASNGGFEIISIKGDHAEFVFRNMQRDSIFINRRVANSDSFSCELYIVEKGTTVDIENAIVIKVIEVINRVYGDSFVWSSNRTGKNVTLRTTTPQDLEATEKFLIEEFFHDYSKNHPTPNSQ